ncbi:MAG: ribonuclease D [Candidatus Lumbricidophila eiseniae]|uniref:Ribonuclease D n=1 Tax=Candidatus Lumbricidiphila eiseniae TaxID=1969409 RepID=A0A2A6FQI6_9MICO|nr:MAG: ribonuclease D [Candidatus Lumbricidophila eiseniae]
MTDYVLVNTPAEYARAVERLLAASGPVAVDAERASGYRYSQRAYLIQMFRRGAGTFLFDPIAVPRFDDLQAGIRDEEWVLHAASQDLPCLREVGLDPRNIFDTELAARLLGMPRVGLAAVVEELLGITLAKKHSAADWSTRPLPDSWLEYAALDVDLLVDVRDLLVTRLAAAGKTHIAAEEFNATLAKEAKPAAAEPWRRLSGIHALHNPRKLAIARELWLARETLAAELDVSPGRLVPDTSLSSVAAAMPTSRSALAALHTFTGRASRSELERWWQAVERGRTATPPARHPPSEGPPPPRMWATRNPSADIRLRLARESLTELAGRLSMPLENLLTPDYLRRVTWHPPHRVTTASINDQLRALGARNWQRNTIAAVIVEAFVHATQLTTLSGIEPGI